MGIKKHLKDFAEVLTNTYIIKKVELPRGIDIFHDLRSWVPSYIPAIIFDVGANIGQSATAYIKHFPEAKIYCFEPSPNTFKKLKENMGAYNQVQCIDVALGERPTGKVYIRSEGLSTRNRLIKTNDIENIDRELTDEVAITNLDEFCRQHKINEISFLKIDTEGSDLDIVKGAKSMLTNNSINFVEVEVGLNSKNKDHIPIEDLKYYLESYEYSIFGIYEQHHEWPEKSPNLRRANVVFISPAILNRFKGKTVAPWKR